MIILHNKYYLYSLIEQFIAMSYKFYISLPIRCLLSVSLQNFISIFQSLSTLCLYFAITTSLRCCLRLFLLILNIILILHEIKIIVHLIWHYHNAANISKRRLIIQCFLIDFHTSNYWSSLGQNCCCLLTCV